MAQKTPSPQVMHERLLARLRLRHLRLLSALAHQDTLAEAAREMGVTQSAASQMLTELERLTGLTLFERHRRGLRPTEAGAFITRHSQRVLASMRHAADTLSAIGQGQPRPLCIGAISSAITGVLRPLLPLLMQRLPELEVRVEEEPPMEIENHLRSGSLQLGLVRALPDTDLSSWVQTPVLQDEIAVVASPRHPLSKKRGIELATLADQPWLLPQVERSTTGHFLQACLAAGFTPRRNRWQCLSLDMVPGLTAGAAALAPLPRSLARPLLERGEVSEIRLKTPIPLPALVAIHLPQETHPQLADFLGVLQTPLGGAAIASQ